LNQGTFQVDAPPKHVQADTTFNIASHLTRMADTAPGRTAVILSRTLRGGGRKRPPSITFAQLEDRSNRCAAGLTDAGIQHGTRVLVMLRPGFEFLEVVFALFKMGAVPVMIDPGMGLARMLACIRQVAPQALIGIPRAHVLRRLRRAAFGSIKCAVTTARRSPFGGLTLARLRERSTAHFETAETKRNDVAAILFTSGATGPPKGVVYEHGMFAAQVNAIQARYSIEPGEIDLPTFPLFGLFGPALGMTCVIPDMDATRPARANPANIVDAITIHRVTNTFGSPALWRRVGEYCLRRRTQLPTLRRVLIAGAPVSPEIVEMLREALNPTADVHTPYGATEALPVSSISGGELLDDCADKSRRGHGICVGRPLAEMNVRFIRITDDAIQDWSDDLPVQDGVFGEIVVAGPVVTKEYFGLPGATKAAKISENGRIWHRMGDVGYRDADGRIWYCGRKAHVVATGKAALYSVCCEAVFNQHPHVRRSALVGIGPPQARSPVLIVEPVSRWNTIGRRRKAFLNQLRELGRTHAVTKDIKTILFHGSLPVDSRHNAKINREALAKWAESRAR